MRTVARTQRLAALRAWADERGLRPNVHGDGYVGASSGVPIALDTGVRDSGEYDVVVRVSIACGIASIVLKKRSIVPIESHRVVRAVHERLQDADGLRSAFIGRDFVELRFPPAASIDRIAHAIDTVVAAWCSPEAERSAYR